ncbi:hypothetical protein N7455_001763 [Penicillium solitum]|uniref:uncharacterized protein n=1 Tax=Penicillium solitum TaxID=60172 RepID=UPI0032C3E52A|nr:hypothetical protein N7536_005743 [Penicillium majusculum]KAJ5878298.1 hypothetical protein N7455_001763 [Penicillium solitum]
MSINIKSKAKEYYGFVHSPAFQKQQPESAVTQNTTQREWCCIALPKRIHTKRALCKLYGSLAGPYRTTGRPRVAVIRIKCEASECLVCLDSSIPMRLYAVFPFHMTTRIDNESV